MNTQTNEERKKKISIGVKESTYFIELQNIKNNNIQLYNENPKRCPHCNKIIPYEKRHNKYCSSICNGFCATKGHHHSEETKEKIGNAVKGIIPWNKGNHKEKTSNHIIKIPKTQISRLCPVCNKTFIIPNEYSLKIFCTTECHNKDQKNGYQYSKKPKIGGYQQGSGRGKKGYYKGLFCDSTYELVWIIYQLDHNIIFNRNRTSFIYTHNGKQHKYYPDFILPDNTYIEIKLVI